MDTSLRRRPRGPRLLALAAASTLTALLLLFANPITASAHDELIGSDPAADATVAALPEQLTLTFSGALLSEEGSAELQVTDSAGASLVDGTPIVQDNTVTQALTGTADGVITVLWRVASGDGHPVSGQFAFTVEGSTPPTPTPTPSATATTSPTTPAPSEASASPTVAPPISPAPAGDASPLPWILGIVGILLVAAVIYLLASRSRRAKDLAEAQPKAPAGPSGPDSSDPSER